jgi:hypothetical protein
LQTDKWGCHRDSYHRGTSLRRLVKAILGCSSNQAELIIKQYNVSDPDTLEAALSMLEGTAEPEKPAPVMNWSITKEFSQFKPDQASWGVTKRFFTLTNVVMRTFRTILKYDLDAP